MISILLYFLPTIIAILGARKSTVAIFMTDLLLGWTGIFWIFTLVWALMGESRNERS